MRILLLGATGQLGRQFIEDGGLAARGELMLASRSGQSFDGSTIEVADLAEPASLSALLDRLKPEVIVNAAAYTAVDRAEQEEPLASRINGEAVGVIGQWAARHHALVVHYSTDYVFDGEQPTPYAVDAPTAPLGAYGRSKLAGERALRQSGAASFIFRTAWVYAAHGHNFLRTMLRLGVERDQLRVVADQHGAPTSAALIVSGTLAALDRWLAGDTAQRAALQGTYHLVASGQTSWHGFARAIFELAGERGVLSKLPQVEAITSAEFPTPARRPHFSALDNRGFAETFHYALPDWQTGLAFTMKELNSKDSIR